jgi:NADP-dependent aldehyde dehydrogenase
MKFQDASIEEIDIVMQESWTAFHKYRKISLAQRASFMRSIAEEIEALGDELLHITSEETNLPEPRLRVERTRTLFQLKSYADACERGDWLEARIDTAIPDRNPPKPDIRKMLIPLGPVLVFGASNFPYAYSTAGGDTACAFAAGCPVIVKAHPAHARTSEMIAGAIKKAVQKNNLPEGVFAHVYGTSFEVGKALVMHPNTKAIGFTGSFQGGKSLFDWSNQRKVPIPVFAEMGSINPVFLFPEKLQTSAGEVAKMYAASITLSVGQFCTNPGLIVSMEGNGLTEFIYELSNEIKKVAPAKMLHAGIASAYAEKRKLAMSQADVETIAVSEVEEINAEGLPAIASATAQAFLSNPLLHQEVFGPYSLIVRCKSEEEMMQVVQQLEGQLTATIVATENDVNLYGKVIDAVKNICGRFIYNGVPTGVEVSLSMHHGGPFPATTDSRFTSVGADGIKRFARPICYQNWSNDLLPDELKNENPLNIWRTVNDQLSKNRIEEF